MTKQERISSLQLGTLTFFGIVATAMLTVPNNTGYFARNDMWLSTIWASIVGFITFYFVWRLSVLFPQQNLIQISEKVLGVFFGKGIGLLYIFYFFQMNGIIVRSYAEFIANSFLSRTPLIVMIGSILLLCAYAVRKGIEVIGRAAQIITPFFLLHILFIPLLGKDMEFDNLFPILGAGVLPSLEGALSPQGWFGEIFFLSFLMPYLHDQTKASRVGWITILLIMVYLTLLNLFVLFIFGHHVEDMVYPVMVGFSYIRIADFLENLESLIMSIWVIAAFIKITLFYFVTVLVIRQFFGLGSYQPAVLPAGILIAVFSLWSLPSLTELLHYTLFVFPFYSFCLQTLLPFILLSIARLRSSGKNNSAARIGNTPRQEG